MAYVNNGTERSLKVSVNKVVGGNQVQGYPKTYDGQQAFPGYSTLTDTQFKQLSEGDFTTRYNAFVAYVEAVENGVDFDTDVTGDGAIRAGAACTTTTTAAIPPNVVDIEYAFSIKYGSTPMLACTGTTLTVWSADAVPGVGSILYIKTGGSTIPFNLGSSVIFVSPDLYSGEVVVVSSAGVITSFTGYECSSTPPIVYGKIYYNTNALTGGRLRIYKDGGVIVDIKTQNGAQLGNITMDSSEYVISGEWFSGSANTVKMRICSDSGEMFFDDSIVIDDSIATYTIGDNNSDHYVTLTSGNVALPECAV